MEVLTKIQIAERQLNRAIILFMDEVDIVSAITLAGAAEEILAKLLNSTGQTDLLTEIIQEGVNIGKINGQHWKSGTFRYEFNFIKNELKHHDSGLNEIPLHSYSAVEIIGRAIENFRRVTGRYSEEMNVFQAKSC